MAPSWRRRASRAFYAELGVPDTVLGRFDMVLLHVVLVLRRLREGGEGGEGERALAQGLFDTFCRDMDHNLREMGISDQGVPRHMQRVGEAFYGRAQAYEAALAERGRRGRARRGAGAQCVSGYRRWILRGCARALCQGRGATAWRTTACARWPAARLRFRKPEFRRAVTE